MATSAEIAALRANTGLNTDEVYTDPELDDIIDKAGSVEAASAEVWRSLAAEYSKLVDTKEAGTEHKWSALLPNALKMAEYYDSMDTALQPLPAAGRPRTIPITRV